VKSCSAFFDKTMSTCPVGKLFNSDPGESASERRGIERGPANPCLGSRGRSPAAAPFLPSYDTPWIKEQ
jgi:hypothetical protein